MSQQRAAPDVELASFVAGTAANDVPQSGIRAVERAFVDTVGVTIPGTVEPAGRAARNVFVGSRGGEASVIGTDRRASVTDVALVNATAGHALDFDDVTGGVWHPSVTLVAPILAVGEREGVTGTELVTAFAVGFEVQHYIGEIVLPSHYEGGWHATATIGTFGATAAVASLLGLDDVRTRNALNCAASMPSGLKKNFGTATKPLHAGLAARNGVVAALLAAEDFTAAASAIGRDGGFCDLYSGDEPPSLRNARIPGDPWAIVEEGVDVKKYPCCYYTHAPIAATERIVAEHELQPADVEEVTVHASRGALETLAYDDPTTGLEAKFSMEYTVASAVARDRIGLSAFEDENVDDATVQAIRGRVTIEEDSELSYGPYSATVAVRTTSGDEYVHKQEQPPGTAADPLSDAELRAKFESAVEHASTGVDASRAYDFLDDLRSIEDVGTLNAVLQPT